MKLRSLLAIISLVLIFHVTRGQETSSYYVVIGGFRIEKNAQNFTRSAHNKNIPAVYSYNPIRKLFYVYVRLTENKKEADVIVKNIRKNGEYKDAWVYDGTLVNQSEYAAGPKTTEPEKLTEQVITKQEPTIEEHEPVTQAEPETIKLEVKNETPPPVEKKVRPEGTKPFLFKLVNQDTGKPVTGQIHLQESEIASEYQAFPSNETIYLGVPQNRAGRVYMTCRVIGFKDSKRVLNYNTPKGKGISVGPEEEVVIDIPLTRVKKGDYIELDEVKFFEFSDIMKPGSQRELDELVNLMTDNPKYKVKLHGHTNEMDKQEITVRGDNGEFFALSDANTKEQGTAKHLSNLRAETVKKYLISKGVEESRISAKGDGDLYLVFDPKGKMASGNDRIEVEITKH